MLEKELEKNLVDRVKKLGGKAFKFVSPGNAGVPDRLAILPGNKVGFAEIKRPGGKTTILQERQIRFIRSLDCFVMVVDSEEKIDEFIEVLQNAKIQSTQLSKILYFKVHNR